MELKLYGLWKSSFVTLIKTELNLFTEHLSRLYQRHVGVLQNDDLSELMNGPIRKKLGIIPDNVTWGGII